MEGAGSFPAWLILAQLRHPDVACALAQRKDELVDAYAGTEACFLHFAARAVKVNDVKRCSGGPLCRWVQMLRPDALESVTLGEEVQNVSIQRPPRRCFDTGTFGDLNPFALTQRYAVAQGCNENGRTALFCLQRHVEREPLAIGREMRAMQVVFRMLDYIHSLSRRDINRAVTEWTSPVVENPFTVWRPFQRSTAIITKLFSYTAVDGDQIKQYLIIQN